MYIKKNWNYKEIQLISENNIFFYLLIDLFIIIIIYILFIYSIAAISYFGSRYMLNSNELTVCYDSIIQPNLRILIKKMLIYVYGRILELKNILIAEDSSIYTLVEYIFSMLIRYTNG